MKVGVFCSANDAIARRYQDEAIMLGKWLAEHGHTLVYGGCDSGLMELIGRTVHENGGQTIGVVPSIVEQGGRRSDYVDIEIPCDDLSDRKALMMMQADIFVALPGGIGTLDEIFTVAASSTIGYHHKRVVLSNVSGFWNNLISVLDNMQACGMMRADYHRYIGVAASFDELICLMEKENNSD